MSEGEPEAQAEAPEEQGEPAPQADAPSIEDIPSLIAKYDKSGNGKLEFDEFLGFMKEGLKYPESDNFMRQMRFLFDGMDTDGSHNLDKNEILTCFNKLKDKDFKYITKMVFRGADIDNSRKVTINELKQAANVFNTGFSPEDFETKCKNEFGGKKKELEYWEFYKLFSGETIPKDSAERDPYDGKLPEKSKCCLLL